MRTLLAGIILVLTLANGAFGQATGFVTALGFQGNYRPDCWTALLVHLDSTVSNADEYQVQVHQQDLDKDVVVYTRTVSLGPQAHQDYWIYFIPQATRQPDGSVSLPADRRMLAEVLKVYLYDKSGKRVIASLPIGFSVNNVDPVSKGFGNAERGQKVILAVLDTARPSFAEYTAASGKMTGSVGMMEDPTFIPVKTRELPESVLAYQAVDVILWLDANARDVSAGGASGFDAIQEWVRQGGHLVICQPPEQRVRIKPFADADMLPIVAYDALGEWAIETRGRPDLKPLVDLARTNTASQGVVDNWPKAEKQKPSWDFARAKARPDAVVDAWIDWDPAKPGTDRTPYIARRAYGLGAVTWVAQDLGEPTLGRVADKPTANNPGGVSPTAGWPHVWDRVCGLRNITRTGWERENLYKEPPSLRQQYDSGDTGVVDLGGSLLKGMEHTARGAWLITLAVFFFIGYWIIAGPGSYLFLAGKKKTGLSWMAFALIALVATGLTVLVVRLVLRGSAEAKHISFVRMVPGGTAPDGTPLFATTINTRFGLYIPRDGYQDVSVPNPTPGQLSYLTPFAIHPQHLPSESGFTDVQHYTVNTDDYRSEKPVVVQVPFRRTLKKLQGQWRGDRPDGIGGTPRLVPVYNVHDPITKRPVSKGTIAGKLTNNTGQDLRNIYLAFRYEDLSAGADAVTNEFILYLPSWPKTVQIDLEAEYAAAKGLGLGAEPGKGNSVKGQLGVYSSFPQFLYRGSMLPSSGDDQPKAFIRALPMMALFDRVGPSMGESPDFKRWEIYRRGGRDMNMSQLLAAGRLVIVAVTEERVPLPMRVEVNEEPVTGEGITFYEIALPLDRTALVPTTKPATQPASNPASRPAEPAGATARGG